MAVRVFSRRRDDRGAAAVEFALVLPILMMTLFGFISTGLAYSDHLSATNAVREGARYGAAADITNASWASNVKDRVKQVYFNESINPAELDNDICVRLMPAGAAAPSASYTGSDCGSAPPLPANMEAGSCAVQVWLQRPDKIELIVFPDLNFTIRADSTAYYSREEATTCPAP
jgi:Flp pilus assembly pilin Flp